MFIKTGMLKPNMSFMRNFKIAELRSFLAIYDLIIYVRCDGISSNKISLLRAFSLSNSFKVLLINSNQVKGFMVDSYTFQFLTTGRCLLLGFKNWADLARIFEDVIFLRYVETLKIFSISWKGFFFNIYKKNAQFREWLISFCKDSLLDNKTLILSFIFEIIYVIFISFIKVIYFIISCLSLMSGVVQLSSLGLPGATINLK